MFVIKTLEQFGKKVVKEARTNLTKKKKNSSKELYNSVKYDLEVKDGKTILSFSMADYGQFIDKGVKGVGGTKADGSRWNLKKVTNNDFKYRSKMPPTKAFDQWVIKKGLAGRNKKGQFVSRESLKFAIAKSVYHTGIETTNFFTKPLDDNFNKLSDELLNSFGNDIVL